MSKHPKEDLRAYRRFGITVLQLTGSLVVLGITLHFVLKSFL